MPDRFTRRGFLLGAAGTAGALAAGAWRWRRADASLPPPGASGIDHIVVVTMENRSFDHFLGWLPGANGRQSGLTYLDAQGSPHATHPLAPDFQGCGHPDPDHSYAGGRVEYDGGACDGWLRAGSNDDYAIGYYTDHDLAFLGRAAADWTTLDGYFAAIMAETYPNRVYLHAAQTDRLSNTTTLSTLPTIWDRLAAAGVSGRYYYSDVPFLALWGARYVGIGRPFAAFLTDCAAGTLPAVSYVDPRFLDEQSGTSGDDHPHADIRNGEAFLNSVYAAVTRSPAWGRTLLVITYDEWGGFFDHVPPDVAPVPPADAALGSDGRRGFRVPCLLVSPWATRRTVSSATLDHTSILRTIEWRWSLPPLTVRDANAGNLADVLDLNSANLAAPVYPVPSGPFGVPCTDQATTSEWTALRSLATANGWPSAG
ncbi:MAG TPA: alkaline phosphatase family protein [Candidatus Dormibacteraeota bacterium]|nr:alkaline phosphatase family protein [Candidatus Dormibacteraeota bacterium]